MNQEVTLFIIGQAFVLAGIIIAAYFNLLSKVNDNHLVLSGRMMRLETAFELMGQNAAKVLHRDDDCFGIDDLLDKYLDRHYELTWKEWELLKTQCQLIVDDPANQPGYRSAAAMLVAICAHKLHIPPNDHLRFKKKPDVNFQILL